MEYLISIITPVYNAVKYLPRAFDSLKAQTIGFDKLQVILIDDHSTDDSLAMINKWAAEYSNVCVLQTEENSGSASTPRNVGIKAATAPYMMFLDNDDFYEADACEALYNEMQASNADIVTGYYRNIDENGAHINERTESCLLDSSISRKEYTLPQEFMQVRGVEMIFWCKIFKTSIIRDNNLTFIPHSANEDIVFLAEYMLLCKKLVYINKLIYNCNTRTDSLSRAMPAAYLIDRAQCYEKILDLYTGANLLDCFNEFYYNLVSYNLSLIFSSEKIDTDKLRTDTLKPWIRLVKYTLDNNLLCHNEYERNVFENWVNENYAEVIKEAPFAIELSQTQDELKHYKHEAEYMTDLHARAQANAENMDRVYASLKSQYDALSQQNMQLRGKLDAIHRSRVFQAACKFSKDLSKL